MRIAITPALSIDADEVALSFIQASGPGGQNVNKVATAVQLRFDAAASPSLPAPVKARLATLAGSRMTNDGVVVITARRFRSQDRNRQDALERLTDLLRAAAERQTPRRPTRPTLASKRRRLDAKQHRAALKRGRGAPQDG